MTETENEEKRMFTVSAYCDMCDEGSAEQPCAAIRISRPHASVVKFAVLCPPHLKMALDLLKAVPAQQTNTEGDSSLCDAPGGGGDEEQQLQELEALLQQLGITPEELMQMLSGAGDGSAAPADEPANTDSGRPIAVSTAPSDCRMVLDIISKLSQRVDSIENRLSGVAVVGP